MTPVDQALTFGYSPRHEGSPRHGRERRPLGHVDIVPSLNQSEYDYFYALTEPVGPTADNRADEQPPGCCDWEPCPHGCCLSWNGREKFHAGMVWMEFLIDHLLRPGAFAKGRADARLAASRSTTEWTA